MTATDFISFYEQGANQCINTVTYFLEGTQYSLTTPYRDHSM